MTCPSTYALSNDGPDFECQLPEGHDGWHHDEGDGWRFDWSNE